jgi:Ca2+-transporting ATPase
VARHAEEVAARTDPADAGEEPLTVRPPAGTEGLRTDEVAARLLRDGPNRIVPDSRRGRLRHLLGPLADPMVALLVVAAGTYVLIGDTADAVVATAALVPIAAVGWLLEARAEHTLDRLRQLTAPTALVWRDGHQRTVAAEELVVGDLVWIHEGDVVPADGTALELTQLSVDESALTGESLPVTKATDGDAALLAGTTVLAGRAILRVTDTGTRTRYGRVGALVAGARPPSTPLQRALARLVGVLAVIAALFCVAVVSAELIHGSGWGEAVIAGVSLAIAAIPEEFSMVYTLYLALGAWHLARGKALVRRLPGVETLGSTTVICTDKTGTLTEGRLAVAALATSTSARQAGGPLSVDEHALLEAAVYACEPHPFDPLDLCIVEHARTSGLDVDALHAGRLVADWPFDPADAYLTHVWQRPDGSHRVAAKGSLEGVLAHAAADPATRGAVQRAHDDFADAGMRIIAVAAGASPAPSGDRATDEIGLAVLGLVAFSDPTREGVADALAECRAAGVRVIMITGDHPATAHAVAEGLDLPHEGEQGDLIATGDDLDRAGPDELSRLAATTNVFARTRPEQKHLLVEELRRQGEVVAMTGDGINDAPALRAADIGVAMGRRGTEVAREAATIVLLDDNFATIVEATRNGRRIYDNLTRAFAYLIAFHPPLLGAALLIPLLDRPLLLLPVHLVLLELLLHPIVSLVFQADPADADVMRRPPRPAGYALSPRALWRPYAIGVTLAIGIVALFLLALHWGWPVEQARAAGFITLLAAQPPLLLVARRPESPVWQGPANVTRELLMALVLIAIAILAGLYLPPMADLLQLEPFPRTGWWWVLGIAAGTTLWSEPLKRARS